MCITCGIKFTFRYGSNFTYKAFVGRDIVVNWFNWPINQLRKHREKN